MDAYTEEITFEGYTIKIIQDTDPINPRTHDQLGTMVCFHNRYQLGDDDHGLSPDNFNGWNELEEHIKKKLDACVVLPLYLYDHSGITMNTTGFSCNWDSGMVGFIYISKEKTRKEYVRKRITKELKKIVTDNLVIEVDEYDKFLTGDVWGYDIIDPDGNELEDGSCWGYYGQDFCIEDAKGVVKADIVIRKEIQKVNDTPLKKLPTLIGTLKYKVSKDRLTERLKEEE